MKLFKRLAAALLAGGLALCMMAGCSETPAAPQAPTAPSDPDSLAYYQEYQKCLKELNYDATLTYSEELSEIAAEVAKAKSIKPEYNDGKNAESAALAKLSQVATLQNVVYIGHAAKKYTEPTADSYKNYSYDLKTYLAVPYNANYIGVAVVEVDGQKYSCALFVRAR